MGKNKNLPAKLYKYSVFDENQYYKALLENNVLYCASPNKFNDPFDSRVYPDYSLGSEKQILDKINEHVKHVYKDLPSHVRKEVARHEYNKNIKVIKSPELMKVRMDGIVDSMYGICSLTEKRDNLLMWAHYGGSHVGFCVEFDFVKLNSIIENYIKIDELVLLQKVKYSRNYPSINPYGFNYEVEDYMQLVLTKSVDWEYENEWRIIYTNNPNKIIKIPDDVMTGVYFGTRCDENKIQSVMKLLDKKKNVPTLYRAKIKQGKFGLIFDKLR